MTAAEARAIHLLIETMEAIAREEDHFKLNEAKRLLPPKLTIVPTDGGAA